MVVGDAAALVELSLTTLEVEKDLRLDREGTAAVERAIEAYARGCSMLRLFI